MKAEEAAREILKARKRKQKLFSGQYDVYPQGDALKYAVIEFEDFEKDYLALFIGKEYTDSVQLTYYYSPDSQNGNSFNLFYLHPEKGIADTNLPGYKPVQVSINPINVGSNPETYFIKANNTFDSLETKKSPGFIFYRFPRQTEVSILNGTDRINNFTIDIYQYGAPVKIPVPFLKNWIMK